MTTDHTGHRYGKLIILGVFNSPRSDPTKRPYRKACVRCDCGTIKDMQLGPLLHGSVTACGCQRRAFNPDRKSATRLYSVWQGMIGRTTRPSASHFANYGGRGIKPDPDWLIFENFKAWAEANGYADHLSLERRDNDLGYGPDNCVWIARSDQNKNRRTNKMNQTRADELRALHATGEHTSKSLAERYGVSPASVHNIINGMAWKTANPCKCCGRV